ncbi:MAG TPA: hypothetical protein VJ691_05615 [Vicinamibacterales bacterium]|nr:hypothetical protein [Vicinamibacterales bacterium]
MIVATALVAVTPFVTLTRAADDPIFNLNRAVQERFKGIDRFFGLRRIVVPGDTPHQFQPEKVGESEAVQELRNRRLSVALYMAGRRVLEREPNLLTKEPNVIDRRVIFGPIAVTQPSELHGLPHAVDLIEHSRDAFRHLRNNDRYDVTREGWTFSGRAIRAESAECLNCHRDRALGDALGVVWYAYRSARVAR